MYTMQNIGVIEYLEKVTAERLRKYVNVLKKRQFFTKLRLSLRQG